MDMRDARDVMRCHIKFFGGVFVVEAFCVASALSTLYLHLDPLNKLVTAVAPYITEILAKILSAL